MNRFVILGLLVFVSQVHQAQAGPLAVIGCLTALCVSHELAQCVIHENAPLTYINCLFATCSSWKTFLCAATLAAPTP